MQQDLMIGFEPIFKSLQRFFLFVLFGYIFFTLKIQKTNAFKGMLTEQNFLGGDAQHAKEFFCAHYECIHFLYFSKIVFLSWLNHG